MIKSTKMIMILIVLMAISVFASEKMSIEHLEYQLPSGQKMQVLFCHPQPGHLTPLVIYNHGLIVQNRGYEAAAQAGYNVDDFVTAIAESGFVGCAPLRPKEDQPIQQIITTVITHLGSRKDVDLTSIGLVGFSMGGLETLRVAPFIPNCKAVVLMSPGLTGPRDNPSLKNVYDNLPKVKAPFMVTLGISDPNLLINHVKNVLIPELQRLNKEVDIRLDYHADHSWFWKIRPEYWNDISRFLHKHIKIPESSKPGS